MPVAYQCRRCKGPPLPHEWEGPCPNCGGFYRANRIFVRDGDVDGAELAAIEDGQAISMGDLMAATAGAKKIPTGLPGVDHLLDGGLPAFGAAALLCGEAGAGKTTFLMVLFRALAFAGHPVAFISAEQGLKELAQQFVWLGKFPSQNFLAHYEQDRDGIIKFIEKNRAVAYAVDSLHAVKNVTDDEGYSMATGGGHAVAQVATDLKEVAREREALIFAIGHLNTDGTVAGGTRVRHMLDGTLVMRQAPGLSQAQRETDPRRFLQIEGKTRLGPRGRRALFMMRPDSFTDEGPVEYDDPGDDGDGDEE